MTSDTMLYPPGDEPRKLTDEEIHSIVSYPIIPNVLAASERISEHNRNEICRIIKLHLEEIEIRPSKIETLKAFIYNRCMRAHINPGDTVGLQAAEAIGEPVTQAVLNTFHKAGSTEVGGTTKLQLITELLQVSQNRKDFTAEIHFKKNDLSYYDALHLTKAFCAKTIRSLLIDPVGGMEILTRDNTDNDPQHYRIMEAVMPGHIPSIVPGKQQVFLRLKFDTFALFEARITTSDIAETIERESFKVTCVPSPTKDGYIDVFSMIDKFHSKKKKNAGRKKIKPRAPIGVRGRVLADALELAKTNVSEEGNGVSPTEFDINQLNPAILDNAQVLFLQTEVIPRIMNDRYAIQSKVGQKALGTIVPKGKTIPQSAHNLSLFSLVLVVKTNVADAIRGATKTRDPRVWRLWLNNEKILTKGIPREKILNLVKSVFPQEAVILADHYLEIHFAEARDKSPLEEITKTVSKLNEEVLENARSTLESNATRRTVKSPQRPEILVHSEYISLRGRKAITDTLNRLITHPAINGHSTITNNPHEILRVRGIEAARAYIYKEIMEIIGGENMINPRHVQLVVDVMSSKGALMPYSARGLERQQLGAYSDSSFEQALNAFKRSAIIGSPEPVSATSAAILVGVTPFFGTGSFKIIPPGGYTPPAYLTAAIEAAKAKLEEYRKQDEMENAMGGDGVSGRTTNFENGTTLDTYSSFTFQNEGGFSESIMNDPVLGEFVKQKVETFNTNVYPPEDDTAYYGLFSNREMLSRRGI